MKERKSVIADRLDDAWDILGNKKDWVIRYSNLVKTGRFWKRYIRCFVFEKRSPALEPSDTGQIHTRKGLSQKLVTFSTARRV